MRLTDLTLMLLFAAAVAVTGCKQSETTPEEAPEPSATGETSDACADVATGANCTTVAEAPAGPVELTAEGGALEPPVAVERIPAGGWYCDMGTVHYARLEHGDGTCPLCGMSLRQRPGGAIEPGSQPTSQPASAPSGHTHTTP